MKTTKTTVSIEEAAREIGCCKEYLRQQMARGEWDIGVVVKRRGKRNYYKVFRGKLDAFLGKGGGADGMERG